MRKMMVAVAGAAMLAGCGGGDGGGASGGGLGAGVTACLERAGLKHDPALGTVVLEGADPVFASDAGASIYRAKTAAAAARIARTAEASEAEGSVGRWLYLSRAGQAAKVRACLEA